MVEVVKFFTLNDSRFNGRRNSLSGIVLHSTATPGVQAEDWYDRWNKKGIGKSVHFFVDNTGLYQYMECHKRAAHTGGAANDTHMGVEMCEPKYLKYTSGSRFTCSNYDLARQYVQQSTHYAVILFARLCKEYNLNPLEPGVIISHKEAHNLGLASDHGDPEHLWNGLKMDYNMNKFRQAVYNELQKLIREEDEDMDVNRFKELWYEMRKEFQDNDAGSWSKEARNWAIETGLVQGTGEEEFNGAWEDVLTREQLVAVLHRFAKLIGKA